MVWVASSLIWGMYALALYLPAVRILPHHTLTASGGGTEWVLRDVVPIRVLEDASLVERLQLVTSDVALVNAVVVLGWLAFLLRRPLLVVGLALVGLLYGLWGVTIFGAHQIGWGYWLWLASVMTMLVAGIFQATAGQQRDCVNSHRRLV